jgi:hypothetical protein
MYWLEQLATAKVTEKRQSYLRDCLHFAVLLISRFFHYYGWKAGLIFFM